MRIRFGFSLIELLIVITIVGVIAAIAMPAYSRYTQKVKLSGVVNLANDFASKASVFYGSRDVFPNRTQLGYSGNGSSDATAIIDPANYLAYVSIFPGSGATSCRTGTVLFYFYGTASGNDGIPDLFPEGIGNSADYNGAGYGAVVSADIDGTLQKFCFYNLYGPGNTFVSGDYIHGCVNIEDNPTYVAELDTVFNSCQ